MVDRAVVKNIKSTVNCLFKLYILFSITINFSSFSETLSGDIGGRVLTLEQSPYVVESTLIIPEDKILKIKEGCVLLFKPFTEITVEGSFIVEGSIENPVVFTSLNDTKYRNEEMLPNAFDWLGIRIKSTVNTIKMSNFILNFSTFGIKSQIKSIIIYNGKFNNNGQYNFTINENPKPVNTSELYSYQTYTLTYDWENADGGTLPENTNVYEYGDKATISDNKGKLLKSGHSFTGWNTQKDGQGDDYAPGSTIEINSDITLYAVWQAEPSDDIKKKPEGGKKKTERTGKGKVVFKKSLPYLVGGTGLVSGAVSLFFLKETNDINNAYKDETNISTQKALKAQRETETIKSVFFGSVSLIAIPTSVILFIRNKKNVTKNKPFSVMPVITPESKGIVVSVYLK